METQWEHTAFGSRRQCRSPVVPQGLQAAVTGIMLGVSRHLCYMSFRAIWICSPWVRLLNAWITCTITDVSGHIGTHIHPCLAETCDSRLRNSERPFESTPDVLNKSRWHSDDFPASTAFLILMIMPQASNILLIMAPTTFRTCDHMPERLSLSMFFFFAGIASEEETVTYLQNVILVYHLHWIIWYICWMQIKPECLISYYSENENEILISLDSSGILSPFCVPSYIWASFHDD